MKTGVEPNRVTFHASNTKRSHSHISPFCVHPCSVDLRHQSTDRRPTNRRERENAQNPRIDMADGPRSAQLPTYVLSFGDYVPRLVAVENAPVLYNVADTVPVTACPRIWC